MSTTSQIGLRVGYGVSSITVPQGAPLCGRPGLLARRARSMRDTPVARALHVQAGTEHFTLVSVDLLVATQRLQRASARAAGISPDRFFLCATHTHSSLGGYWRGPLVERFMGPFAPDCAARLAAEIGLAAGRAVDDARPATAAASETELDAVSVDRRGGVGKVDPTLALVRFEVRGRPPVYLISFGAHPVTMMQKRPHVVSADFPGEVCRHLERRGCRPLFVQAAVGGTSPAFLRVPADRGIRQMGSALEQGIVTAERHLTSLCAQPLIVRPVPLETFPGPCRIFPNGVVGKPLLDLVERPLATLLNAMARQGFRDNPAVAMHLLQMGSLALLLFPAEIGPSISNASRTMLRFAGLDFPVVVSMCNGYTGYAHLPEAYEGGQGISLLSLYENAMSLAGWEAGARIVDALARALAAPDP